MCFKKHILPLLLFFLTLYACKTGDDVTPSVEEISVSPNSIELEEGKTLQLTPQITPATAQPTLIWSSSNEKVATVSQEGLVTAEARGDAVIFLDADGLKVSVPINVTREDLPYQLVWSDEFEGSSLDQSKWSYEYGGKGWGNRELQYYTDRAENIRVENGNLIIEARKETYTDDTGQTNDYTSARIVTRDKAEFTYGKIEARISLPAGKGTWPAFWMLGTYTKWPLGGEIDIMEHIGSQPTMISHAIHTYEKNGSRGNNWHNQQYPGNVENSYHTYAIEWEKRELYGNDCIKFYIDGKKTAEIWEPNVGSDMKNWPFNHDFFIILNLAIGGTMGGSVDNAIFNSPVIMKVDYVRVYQRK